MPSLLGKGTSIYWLLATFLTLASAQWGRTRNTGLPKSEFVTVVVAFHQPRVHEAEKLLLDLSNPTSSRFGQYLSATELEQFFQPAQDSVDNTMQWLGDVGIPRQDTRLQKGRGLLRFSATVQQMYELLGDNHDLLRRHMVSEDPLQETEHLVPRHLRKHIDSIEVKAVRSPKVQARDLASKHKPPYKIEVAPDLTNCSLSWTPACIRQLYDIPLGTKAAPNNSVAIFGYGDYYNQTDLDNFFKLFAEFVPQGTSPKVNFINGAEQYAREIDGEESLDLMMAYPIAYPGKVEIYQMPYSDLNGMANDFLDAVDASYCDYDGGDDPENDRQYPAFLGFQGPRMCGTYNAPKVLSISFAKDESALPRHYVERQCREWMKLALQGVTVLVSAGDRGVSGNFGCVVNTETAGQSSFNPLFPGTCPYVTTVGATQVNFTGKRLQEVSVYDKPHNYWSGGGFSNYNGRPSYQEEAVSRYLAAHSPQYPPGTYNATGRAFPDVALLGANVTISDKLEATVSGGTSAAAPLFAAMISRINDERLLRGKGPIGFLNQILYQHPEVFTDITDGSNPGCDTAGFTTAEGWDPVSGMGSPKFPKLRNLLVGLP